MVVAVPTDEVRFDEREFGQRSRRCVSLELGERHHVRRQQVLQARVVDEPVERDRHRLRHVDLPALAVLLEPFEDRLGVVLRQPLLRRRVHDEPRRGRRRPEGAVHERLRRHLREPVIEDAELTREPVQYRELLRGEPGHDLRVLLVGRLAAQLAGERADVVDDEPVHRRCRARLRRIPRRGHVLADLAAVVLVEDAEQLRVRVVPLLARVRVRGVQVRRDRVRHDLSLGAVLGPVRDRVAQLLPEHALEGLAVAGAVQVP